MQKKKEWIKRKIKEINETDRKKDTRKFYKDVRNLSNLPIAMTLVCKDKTAMYYQKKKNTGKMATLLQGTTKS